MASLVDITAQGSSIVVTPCKNLGLGKHTPIKGAPSLPISLDDWLVGHTEGVLGEVAPVCWGVSELFVIIKRTRGAAKGQKIESREIGNYEEDDVEREASDRKSGRLHTLSHGVVSRNGDGDGDSDVYGSVSRPPFMVQSMERRVALKLSSTITLSRKNHPVRRE